MSKKEKTEKVVKNKKRGSEIFGRIMAGTLVIMMLAGFAATLIFSLMG